MADSSSLRSVDKNVFVYDAWLCRKRVIICELIYIACTGDHTYQNVANKSTARKTQTQLDTKGSMGSFCIFSPTVFWNIGAFASKGSRGQCLGWQCRSRSTASSGLKKPGHKRLPQHRIPATSRWGPARPQYCLVLSCTYIHMYVYMIYIYIYVCIYTLVKSNLLQKNAIC